jgi:hypothetical protein
MAALTKREAELLAWLDAPDEKTDTGAPSKTEILSAVVSAMSKMDAQLVAPAAKDSDDDDDDDRADGVIIVVGLLKLQLCEQEERLQLQQAESDAAAVCYRLLLAAALAYVREREQTLIFDNNKRLIANDLIQELVSANQAVSKELGSVMTMVMQRAAAQQQQQVRGAAVAAATGSSKGKR